MKNKVMPYIRTAVFLAGLIVIIAGLNFMFNRTGYVRYVLHHINDKNANYDTIILGASHARSAINPKCLDDELGTNAYNFAIPGASVKDNYYMLLDAANDNDLKTVIYDVDYYYFVETQDTKRFSKEFICQPITDFKVKVQYTLENMDNIDIRNYFVNRASWDISKETVKSNLKKKVTKEYRSYDIEACEKGPDGYVLEANGPYVGKGYFSRVTSGLCPGGQKFIEDTKDRAYNDLDKNALKWFDKIAEYCDKNNIELICIYSPITPSAMQSLHIDVADEKLKKHAQSKGVEYYNFNLLLQSKLLRTDLDYGDLEGHMGGELGDKYSTVLAQFLKDRKNGTLNENQYFYHSFKEVYDNFKSDYEKVSGVEWGGY